MPTSTGSSFTHRPDEKGTESDPGPQVLDFGAPVSPIDPTKRGLKVQGAAYEPADVLEFHPSTRRKGD